MNYIETIEYLFSSMPSFQRVGGEGYKPGLERMEAICRSLGSPHMSYPVVHIAGTNGKGSTSHMLSSVLQHASLRVGLFTSPHLLDFRERIRINGEMISEAQVVEFVERNRTEMEHLSLSFFEMSGAMAFDHFARHGVDIAVIETGLGGRLDATNIVEPLLSVITNISLDHTQYLGSTLPEIASEKGGIIKHGGAVVLGQRGEEYTHVIEEIAFARGSELIFAEDYKHNVDNYSLDLMGGYQQKNLRTLLTAVEYLRRHINIDEEALKKGLSSVASTTGLLGRWQQLSTSPLTICDTGHNLDGLREVTKQLYKQSYEQLYCILGFTNDKDMESILPLFPRDGRYIFTRAAIPRSLPTESIAEVAQRLSLSFEVADTPIEALKLARGMASPEDMIFIGGSTFVVGDLLQDLTSTTSLDS